MSMPQVVHPWSHAPDTVLRALPPAAAADQRSIAEALFASGFVASAIATAEVSTEADVAALAEKWRETRASDAALSTMIAQTSGALVPSVPVREDGSPRFVLRIPDASAAAEALLAEHGEHGAAAELRLFLDEALRSGDCYIDASPGAGFATLSAVTGGLLVSAVALCRDAEQVAAIEASARCSGVTAQVDARMSTSLGALLSPPLTDGAMTFVHAGSAESVAPLMSDALGALQRREIGAVAWRCGPADEAGRDAENLQIAAAVLGVFGFQHFALAMGNDGPELVPADAMASNEMIFSLEPSLLARFSA